MTSRKPRVDSNLANEIVSSYNNLRNSKHNASDRITKKEAINELASKYGDSGVSKYEIGRVLYDAQHNGAHVYSRKDFYGSFKNAASANAVYSMLNEKNLSVSEVAEGLGVSDKFVNSVLKRYSSNPFNSVGSADGVYADSRGQVWRSVGAAVNRDASGDAQDNEIYVNLHGQTPEQYIAASDPTLRALLESCKTEDGRNFYRAKVQEAKNRISGGQNVQINVQLNAPAPANPIAAMHFDAGDAKLPTGDTPSDSIAQVPGFLDDSEQPPAPAPATAAPKEVEGYVFGADGAACPVPENVASQGNPDISYENLILKHSEDLDNLDKGIPLGMDGQSLETREQKMRYANEQAGKIRACISFYNPSSDDQRLSALEEDYRSFADKMSVDMDNDRLDKDKRARKTTENTRGLGTGGYTRSMGERFGDWWEEKGNKVMGYTAAGALALALALGAGVMLKQNHSQKKLEKIVAPAAAASYDAKKADKDIVNAIADAMEKGYKKVGDDLNGKIKEVKDAYGAVKGAFDKIVEENKEKDKLDDAAAAQLNDYLNQGIRTQEDMRARLAGVENWQKSVLDGLDYLAKWAKEHDTKVSAPAEQPTIVNAEDNSPVIINGMQPLPESVYIIKSAKETEKDALGDAEAIIGGVGGNSENEAKGIEAGVGVSANVKNVNLGIDVVYRMVDGKLVSGDNSSTVEQGVSVKAANENNNYMIEVNSGQESQTSDGDSVEVITDNTGPISFVQTNNRNWDQTLEERLDSVQLGTSFGNIDGKLLVRSNATTVKNNDTTYVNVEFPIASGLPPINTVVDVESTTEASKDAATLFINYNWKNWTLGGIAGSEILSNSTDAYINGVQAVDSSETDRINSLGLAAGYHNKMLGLDLMALRYASGDIAIPDEQEFSGSAIATANLGRMDVGLSHLVADGNALNSFALALGKNNSEDTSWARSMLEEQAMNDLFSTKTDIQNMWDIHRSLVMSPAQFNLLVKSGENDDLTAGFGMALPKGMNFSAWYMENENLKSINAALDLSLGRNLSMVLYGGSRDENSIGESNTFGLGVRSGGSGQ